MTDGLFEELMKEVKKVWEIHRQYYGETDKEITIDADDNAAVEAAEASLDELWLPVSAVTEWRMKAAQKLKDWFDNGLGRKFTDVSEARRLTFEAIDKVLGVKP